MGCQRRICGTTEEKEKNWSEEESMDLFQRMIEKYDDYTVEHGLL